MVFKADPSTIHGTPVSLLYSSIANFLLMSIFSFSLFSYITANPFFKDVLLQYAGLPLNQEVVLDGIKDNCAGFNQRPIRIRF